jgi:hypothetical protein
MPYIWKQELYISFNPTDNCKALKTEFAMASARLDMTFPDDPGNKTYQEERKQAVVFIIHTYNTYLESFLIINPSQYAI